MEEKKIVSARTETNPVLLKNLYRTFYEEKYKKARTVMFVIAIAALLAAAAVYYNGLGALYTIIFAWLGLFLFVYPINMYRRPYKKAKNTKTVTHFDFYGEYMIERAGGETNKFRYGEIDGTLETNQYFYIFHSADTVSVVEKSGIGLGSADELREIFKAKTKYKMKK